jgi:hypothetical protein
MNTVYIVTGSTKLDNVNETYKMSNEAVSWHLLYVEDLLYWYRKLNIDAAY